MPNNTKKYFSTSIQNEDFSPSVTKLHLTFGLQDTFEKILLWAHYENVLDEVLLMIDVCNFRDENKKIAPLLHFLKKAQ